MLCHERLDILPVQVPLPGDAGDLVLGSSDADIRVQPASRCGDQIDWDRQGIRWIGCVKSIGPGFYCIDECGIIRPEVRP